MSETKSRFLVQILAPVAFSVVAAVGVAIVTLNTATAVQEERVKARQEQLERVEAKLDRIDQRIAVVEQRLARVEAKLDVPPR